MALPVRPIPKVWEREPTLNQGNGSGSEEQGSKIEVLGRAPVLVSCMAQKSLPRSGKMMFRPVCAEARLPGRDVILQNGTSQREDKPKASRKAGQKGVLVPVQVPGPPGAASS